MANFFILEAGLLSISAFLLAIIAFTSTRSFVYQGTFKKSFFGAFIFLSLVIALHYNQTMDRMETVKKEFENGKIIICDNKGDLSLGRSVLVDKSRYGWRIEEYSFVSDEYPRDFNIARCVVHLVQE